MTDQSRPDLTPEQQAVLDELAARLQEAIAPFIHSIASAHVALMMRPQAELITVKVVLPDHLSDEDVARVAAEANRQSARAWERR